MNSRIIVAETLYACASASFVTVSKACQRTYTRRTYVATDARPRSSSEIDHRFVHGMISRVAFHPSLGSEFSGILTKYLFVEQHDSGVHSSAVSSRNVITAELKTFGRGMTRHSHLKAGEYPSAFLDNGREILELVQRTILDRVREHTAVECRIDLGTKLLEDAGVLHELVEHGSKEDGCAVSTRGTGTS